MTCASLSLLMKIGATKIRADFFKSRMSLLLFSFFAHFFAELKSAYRTLKTLFCAQGVIIETLGQYIEYQMSTKMSDM